MIMYIWRKNKRKYLDLFLFTIDNICNGMVRHSPDGATIINNVKRIARMIEVIMCNLVKYTIVISIVIKTGYSRVV